VWGEGVERGEGYVEKTAGCSIKLPPTLPTPPEAPRLLFSHWMVGWI